MPNDNTPAIIAAGSQLVGNALNYAAVQNANRKNVKFAREMYDRQRADNLADWNRTNQYNTPEAQMRRLKEAGLNPNMVYGSGATTQAAPIKSADAQNVRQEAASVNVGDVVSGYYDTKLRQAQLDNLRQQMVTEQKKQILTDANTLNVLAGTDLKRFDLKKGESMLDYQVDALKEQILNTRANTVATYGQNEREWRMQQPRIDQLLANIANTKAQTTLVPYERRLKEEQAKNILNSTYWSNMSEAQKLETGKILQEGNLIDNLLKGENVNGARIQNEINRAKAKFREYGLSETIIGDIFRDILKIAAGSK